MTTDEEGPSRRTRVLVAAFALGWGVVFFHFMANTRLWLAVVLGGLLALSYLLRDEGTERIAKLACISAFGGLGGWLVVGLGPWSVAVALVFPTMFLVGERLERRRS